MDDRQYAFFGTTAWCFRDCHGEASARAWKNAEIQKSRDRRAVGRIPGHEANLSPTVHLSQRQLDAILEQAAMRLFKVPEELSA
ncbi:MAG: hypothetical protein EOQ98_29925 [Mesorhizobium sp.]|uniref:hypothetical protein n=1 Tax=Mesorhizobium sp. TaxID=1871066 RepID=UPI000FE7B91A|nr:hypothetical protein [Mesorhizobium sp.]RWO94620.1 MAG: hypothetical protein EOQ98_29925 [Mesorhizobium sp.]TIM50002.1 MAG: hypothetical protein E5Y69_08000 [Mesorhizobium sp.]